MMVGSCFPKVLLSMSLFEFFPVALGKELKSITPSFPPYFLPEKNSGIFMDIVQKAFQPMGIELNNEYVRYAMVHHSLKKKLVDIAFPVPADDSEGVFYTQPCFAYHNVAVTLKDKKISIESTSDFLKLKGKTITAFQNAKKILGKSFADSVVNSKYNERGNLKVFLLKVLNGELDVAILGKQNVLFLLGPNERKRITIHDRVFKPVVYTMGLQDEKLRDEVDKRLSKMKETGEFEKIYKNYVNENKN